MDLNELIHKRLSSYEDLKGILASFAGEPAIFNTEFPPDQSPGWEGKGQYPRICYKIDMQVNQERSSSGTLQIAVYSDKSGMLAEVIEGLVRERLKDILMKPEGQDPLCVAWASTAAYLLEGTAIVCKEIVFDILEYPNQETTDPDPVIAVGAFIKELYPESIVIGLDRLEDYTDPAEHPVFFCRLQSCEKTTGHCAHTICWFNAKVAIHILAPDASVRLKMASAINQKMAMDEEIIMLDQSPMFISSQSLNNKADYLREGQLTVTGKYGCLRNNEKKHNLVGVSMGFVR